VIIYTLNTFSYFVLRVSGPLLQHFFLNVALRAKSLPTTGYRIARSRRGTLHGLCVYMFA